MGNKTVTDIIKELNESAELIETREGFSAAIPAKKFKEALVALKAIAEQERQKTDETSGNFVAMREALVDAYDIIRCYDMAEADGSFANQGKEVGEWFAKADAALSAPMRNAGRFNTGEDAGLAFDEEDPHQ